MGSVMVQDKKGRKVGQTVPRIEINAELWSIYSIRRVQ